MEAPLDLGGMVQSSPLPSVRSLPRNPPPYSQQQQSEADFHSYGNICQQQQQHQSHSADDPNSSIIEHHLIAQYAQELHQGGGGSSTGGGDGGSYINTAPDPGGHMLQQSRELVKTLCFLCKNRQLRAGGDLSFAQNSLSLSENFLIFVKTCRYMSLRKRTKR